MPPTAQPHHTVQPSCWIKRFSHLIPPESAVLDVACGAGRHMHWLAQRGHTVTGVDRDASALACASAWGQTVQADMESGPWPLEGRRFGAVIVTHYLWRPLLPRLLASVAENGVLLYETFATGNETVGRPANADFLLQPGELLHLCASPEWRIVAFEDGFLPQPERFIQRIAAVRPSAQPPAATARYRL